MNVIERLPALAREKMDDAQRKAADELTAGPRGGVKGPFIPLLRSPELMDRLQKVGEYLRFKSALDPRLAEFTMLVVAREWTNHFEWAVHTPLAAKAGISKEAIEAVREGRRPDAMAADEALIYDFVHELLQRKGASETSYERAVKALGERGLMDLAGLIGYFVTVCMVMNIAHTPAPASDAAPIAPFPL